VAEALRADGPAGRQRRRLNHITRHIEFGPLPEAWSAFALHKVLEKAAAIGKDSKVDEARSWCFRMEFHLAKARATRARVVQTCRTA
jgi:hypothetical protein